MGIIELASLFVLRFVHMVITNHKGPLICDLQQLEVSIILGFFFYCGNV